MQYHAVRDERCMDAAHDDGNAARAELGGNLIGARRLRRKGGQADEIGLHPAVIERALTLLVDELDIPLWRRCRRHVAEGERLPEVIAIQRHPVSGIDQNELHAAVSIIDNARPAVSKAASARSICSGVCAAE